MPLYLHQWNYKDQEIKSLIEKPHDRGHVVSLAVRTFGGELHGFYFCFGKYDGVAISEFPDDESAFACMMAVVGQGGLTRCDITPLFSVENGMKSLMLAHRTLKDGAPYQPPSKTE